jgi:DNA-binding transcriptional LysR family regulator
MTFNRELLAAFDAVVEHGSVGRAAVALHATQPTVSRHIRTLEHQIGTTLFDRDHAGMHLTPAGSDLLPHVRYILHEMALAGEAVDAHRGFLRGAVRLGAVDAVARSVLPPILAEVARRAPHLRIEVLVDSEEQLDRALAQRVVDVMFATSPPSEVEAVQIGSREFTDRCVVFCARDHPLHRQSVVAAHDVLQQSWALGHRGATTRDQFETLVRAVGLEFPGIALETDSVDLIISVISRSWIMGWLPEPILRHACQDTAIRVLNLPDLELVRRFRAYRRSRGTFPPGGQVLIDAMHAGAAP